MGSGEWRKRHAARREELHQHQRSHRPLSDRYEELGLAGEQLFAAWSGLDIDRTLKPQGSGSINFEFRQQTINVYTARYPKHLLVEEGKAKATLYVLCGWDEVTEEAYFVGWQFHQRLILDPPRDYGGMGIISYGVPKDELLAMDVLALLFRSSDERGDRDGHPKSG